MTHSKVLKRLCCTLSDECLALIDLLRKEQSRSEWIEEQLWQLRQVQNIARRHRIKKQERRRRGRVRSDD